MAWTYAFLGNKIIMRCILCVTFRITESSSNPVKYCSSHKTKRNSKSCPPRTCQMKCSCCDFHVINICQNITRRPLIRAGALSAAHTGAVADFGPIERPVTPVRNPDSTAGEEYLNQVYLPSRKRAANICPQLFANAWPIHVMTEMKHVTKMVHLRPRRLLSGYVSLSSISSVNRRYIH